MANAEIGHVRHREKTAALFYEIDYFFCDLAFVKEISCSLNRLLTPQRCVLLFDLYESFEGSGQRGLLEPFAKTREFTFGGVRLGSGWPLICFFSEVGHRSCQFHTDRYSVTSVLKSRCHNLLERHRSVFYQCRHPCISRGWHDHSLDARWDGSSAGVCEVLKSH